MAQEFDLVVRHGTIIDGTGSAPFQADIAISGNRISAIGSGLPGGVEEVDAAGCIVTPGFVDVHTHYDGQVMWEQRLKPSSNHGVTTAVMGNCGVGFAPARACNRDLMIRLMEGVEDIPQVVMAQGLPWNWESFPEYLDALSERQCDMDFAAQLPHSPLRVHVMGEKGASMEAANDEELAEMRRLTADAIRAGALGVSSSRNIFHRFRDGKPAPSVHTEEKELMALAAGLRDAGDGVFQINPNLEADAERELALFGRLAKVSGRPLNFSLFVLPHDDKAWPAYVDGIESARKAGMQINGQFLPRPPGVLFGLDLSLNPFSLNPSYRAIEDLPLPEKVTRLRDPELRRRLLQERPEDPNPSLISFVSNPSWKLYALAEPARYSFEAEESLSARAAREGRDLRELIYDALLEDEGHAILCAYSNDVRGYLDHTLPRIGAEGTIVALGDGGAHYSLICDAAYTTYALGELVDREELDLSKLVRALTSQPAASVGLFDRGTIAVGTKADINVIDRDNIVLHRPTVSRDLPSNGKRLSQKASGYRATIVSGEVTYRDGQATGALPGRLVRAGAAAMSAQ
ncbi:N-acyl-D-amino-acid deacylase family protein [Novosphingobium pentaromativorans]|uniref:Amidohydrolase 3 n=1 Tax=Novosphingobium pentaromativorans US6-1 TaxID=1088721 RepID=G6EGQ3_9SPHN|nr:amidohydrolase family protein [Novosphingobium pentaromativorans]AIT82094.1 amidohydrolase [Novosphingobium pentaromativorans US6-1]EHJ59496.1 Amidohydrolase 3 [Novosphingobium pentaromativorans US6-1]